MASLPQFAYFRLSEKRSREPVRYEPDYPLVLFVLFSRWSLGIAVVAGLMQIANHLPRLVTLSMMLALILIFTATLFSIFHLSDRIRFMAMMKNLRSRVSQEVIFAGVFMGLVAIDCLILLVFDPDDRIRILLAGAVIGFGLLALAATGWAYKFHAHPYWNTNILSVYYLISGLFWGASTIFWLVTLFFPFSHLGTSRSMPMVLAGFLLVLFLVGLAYVRYVRKDLSQRFRVNLKDKNGVLVILYALFVFVLPAVSLVASAVATQLLFYSSTFILLSLLVGAFVERVVFFSIESPHYMFRVLSDTSM